MSHDDAFHYVDWDDTDTLFTDGVPAGMRLQFRYFNPEFEKNGAMYVDPADLDWCDIHPELIILDSDLHDCSQEDGICRRCFEGSCCDAAFRLVSADEVAR